MIVVTNTIQVKKGHGWEVAKRFENSRGVDQMPGFIRMEVLFAEQEEQDELKVCTHWENRESFDGWVNSDSFKAAHAHRGGAKPAEGGPGHQLEGERIMLGSKLSTHEVLVSK